VAVVRFASVCPPLIASQEIDMSITGFDHVNIRTMNVPATLGFFRDVLQMKIRPFPGRTDTETAGWVLDDKDAVVIHVNHGAEVYPTDAQSPWSPVEGSGAVHHVALNSSEYEATRERLVALDLDFTENAVPHINLRQLFVREPNGILIELNFRGGA
jgi:catechol 2,3-dioxygenase-like lactoylglutathione lyase family enzyme